MTRKRHMVRTVTPPVVARWLEVKHETVMSWIKSRDLPALNIGVRGKRHRYVIFRKDFVNFLLRRGMTEERVRDLLGDE